MRRILPTVILATVFFACASTPNYDQFSSEDVPQLQSEAESHYGNYQHLDAIDGYLKLTGIALQQLRDPDNLEDKQRLRAELEHYGLRLYIIAGSIDNHRDILKKLDKFHLSSSDGGIYEIYCNFNSDNRANLFYLHDFEFVGPFDNERGGGFDTALAAELDGDSSQIYSGKERDVKWRTTPQPAPRNDELDMGTLIYPHNQSALLMRSWVYNEEQRDAHMVIALEGEIKAWVNGEAVLEARGRHQFSLRNFSKKVSLRKGWNQICFKLGSRNHSPKIAVRFCADDEVFSPINIRHQALPPAQVAAEPLSQDVTTASLEPEQIGAINYFAAEQDYSRLGEFEMAMNAEQRSNYPGRENLARAAQENPHDLNAMLLYAASLFPAPWERAEEIDLNPWLHQSQAISELYPLHSGNLALKYKASYKYQYLNNRSLGLAQQLIDLNPNAPIAYSSLARLHSRQENYDQEKLVLQQVLKHPLLLKFPQAYYHALHVYGPNTDAFLDGMRWLYENHEFVGALNYLIDARRRSRLTFDVEQELAEFKKLLSYDPWDTSLHFKYARRFLGANLPQQAAEMLDFAEKINPEHPRLWRIRARIALYDQDFEKATTHLETELEIDYSDEDEQRLLELVSASADSDSFDAPYREALDAIAARYPQTDTSAGYPLETLLRRAVIKVNPDSTAKRYYRDVVRIQNSDGIRRMARRGFEVRWGLQDLRVLSASVLHADGQLTEVPVGRGYQARVVEFPNLQVGDIVDVEYRIDDLHTSFFGTYFSLNHMMTTMPSMPTRKSELTVIGNSQLPLYFNQRNITDTGTAETPGEESVHNWQMNDIMPLRPEVAMPHASELMPTVQASSYASWDEFGNWWWNLIKDNITVSVEMAAKVKELTANLDTRQQMLTAIYEFVTNEIRYNAWEFGVHGYQPYTAPVIFSRRFGDCKDKAILLRAMLSEVDIEALPVLIMRSATQQLGGRRPTQDLSLAMVEHFNHCIAYIPEQDGIAAQYLDGTANLTPIETLPYDDRGADVVIVGPSGSNQDFIPFKEADFNRSDFTIGIELNPEGSAVIDFDCQMYGSYDNELRRTFANGLEKNQEILKGIAATLFGTLDGDLQMEFPVHDDLSITPTYGFKGNFKKFATLSDGALEIAASPLKDDLFNTYTRLAERDSDLVMRHAFTHQRQYTYSLPTGYRAEALDDVAISNSTGSFSWSMRTNGSELIINESLIVNQPRVSANDYLKFRELCRSVNDTQNLVIEISEAN